MTMTGLALVGLGVLLTFLGGSVMVAEPRERMVWVYAGTVFCIGMASSLAGCALIGGILG